MSTILLYDSGDENVCAVDVLFRFSQNLLWLDDVAEALKEDDDDVL